MRKISAVVLIVVLALPAFAASTGDPIDGNDNTARTNSTVETACDLVEQYPGCSWCLDQCLLAYMMESYYSGGLRSWDWDF